MPTRDEYDTMILLKSINYHLGGTEVCPTLVIQTGFTFKLFGMFLLGSRSYPYDYSKVYWIPVGLSFEILWELVAGVF